MELSHPFLVVYLLVVLPVCISCYSNKAATASCLDLSPASGGQGHQGTEIKYRIPFSITVENNFLAYTHGIYKRITITSGSSNFAFTGLMLQARKSISGRNEDVLGERAVGYFLTPHDYTGVQQMRCWAEGDTITHLPYRTMRELSITWYPPKHGVHNIVFIATIMVNETLWYAPITSHTMSYYKRPFSFSPTPHPPVTIATSVINSASVACRGAVPYHMFVFLLYVSLWL